MMGAMYSTSKKGYNMIYISHPYTGNEEYNVRESEVIATQLAKRFPSTVFINPLTALNHTGYAKLEYEVILKQCLYLLGLCDGIIMTGDWKKSPGCGVERYFAQTHNILIWDSVDEFLESAHELDTLKFSEDI